MPVHERELVKSTCSAGEATRSVFPSPATARNPSSPLTHIVMPCAVRDRNNSIKPGTINCGWRKYTGIMKTSVWAGPSDLTVIQGGVIGGVGGIANQSGTRAAKPAPQVARLPVTPLY